MSIHVITENSGSAGGSVGLPSGYTQVDYIQSSGKQYIDTGYKPNNNTRVVVDCEFEKPSADMALFGARDGSQVGEFALYGRNGGYTYGYGGARATISTSSITGRYTVDANKAAIDMAGISTVAPASTFSTSVSLLLFAYSDPAYGALDHAVAKIYSCQIYDNGTLIRNFVPCENADGAVGLYDLVGSKFYGNSGTGSFVAGGAYWDIAQDVEEVSIIEGGTIMKATEGHVVIDGTTYLVFGGSKPCTVRLRVLAGGSDGTSGLNTYDVYAIGIRITKKNGQVKVNDCYRCSAESTELINNITSQGWNVYVRDGAIDQSYTAETGDTLLVRAWIQGNKEDTGAVGSITFNGTTVATVSMNESDYRDPISHTTDLTGNTEILHDYNSVQTGNYEVKITMEGR